MKAVKFKIENNSRFSVKDTNRDLTDVFSSNTVFSALINNISLIYGDDKANSIIERFKEDKFSISSMFLGLDFHNINTEEVENSLYFGPKPEAMIQKIKVEEDKLEEYVVKRKRAKKIKLISLGALKKMGNFWLASEKAFDFDLFQLESIGEDLACTKEEISSINIENLHNLSFTKNFLQPHVSVDRITSDSQQYFFQEEKIFQYEYVGDYRIEPFMYFMYQGDLTTELKTGINLMVDEGIGGRRSVGMGRFKSNEYVELDIFPSIDNHATGIFINLSSYIPLREEVDHLLGYKLEKTNGYIYSKGGQPYRKKSIGIINEGALTSRRVKGKLLDVTPLGAAIDHKVYYNGKSFSIGIGGGRVE